VVVACVRRVHVHRIHGGEFERTPRGISVPAVPPEMKPVDGSSSVRSPTFRPAVSLPLGRIRAGGDGRSRPPG
jgi:hypothetical protein